MAEFFAFLFGECFWRLYSKVVCWLLRCRWGLQVGNDVEIRAIPKVKLRGEQGGRAVVIGDRVTILGQIDIRTRENGRIEFRKDATIEGGCRFVAANDATLCIGEGSVITEGAIMNAGADLIVGENVVIGPRASINSSEHEFTGGGAIRKLGFTHAAIHLHDGCWLGVNVVVTKGVTVGEGAVVGASSVVTKDVVPLSINVGIPARNIGMRSPES